MFLWLWGGATKSDVRTHCVWVTKWHKVFDYCCVSINMTQYTFHPNTQNHIISVNSEFRIFKHSWNVIFRTNWSEWTGFDPQLKYSIETARVVVFFSALHLFLMNIWLNYMWHDMLHTLNPYIIETCTNPIHHLHCAHFCMKWNDGFRIDYMRIVFGLLSVSLVKLWHQFLAHTAI